VNLNVDVSLQYIAAWLDDRGAVPIHNLMEDAATAEISRAQLWQWAHHGQRTEGGTPITPEGLTRLIAAHRDRLSREQPERAARLSEAADLLQTLVTQEQFGEFLTLPGYQRLS